MRRTLRQEEVAKFGQEVQYALIGVMNDEGYPRVNLFFS